MLWLHGDMAEAGSRFRAARRIGERVGEALLLANSLGSLSLVALSRHDVAAVRDIAPRAVAAAAAVGPDQVAWATAPLAWLAWQDGRPDDVRKIAAEIAGPISDADLQDDGAGADREALNIKRTRYHWVYLLPLIAVCMDEGDTATAVAAARRLGRPGQALLPDTLDGEFAAACRSWDAGLPAQAAQRLAAALSRARDLGFC